MDAWCVLRQHLLRRALVVQREPAEPLGKACPVLKTRDNCRTLSEPESEAE